jgi:hypothetical protein
VFTGSLLDATGVTVDAAPSKVIADAASAGLRVPEEHPMSNVSFQVRRVR